MICCSMLCFGWHLLEVGPYMHDECSLCQSHCSLRRICCICLVYTIKRSHCSQCVLLNSYKTLCGTAVFCRLLVTGEMAMLFCVHVNCAICASSGGCCRMLSIYSPCRNQNVVGLFSFASCSSL